MGSHYKEYVIPHGQLYVTPRSLSSPVQLDLRPSRIKGPGEWVHDEKLPYVHYVGRLYNNSFVPGAVRVKQGATPSAMFCGCCASATSHTGVHEGAIR